MYTKDRRSCWKRTDGCQRTNVCEKKHAQFVVDRAAAAHRPLSGVMATVLQVYTVY